MHKGISPASSGPAGSHFEGQVGASFLLSLLVVAEPRGLPGTIIDRVEFQRAAEGHPLDDVVVHAHDTLGKSAVLEIQVKKGITFTPSDPIFRSVVGQIVKVSRKPEFLEDRYELGIAISRTSRKIDGPYQDVLTWARQLGDAATFVDRINRSGSANDAMRTFVNTFREHLADAGAVHDDNAVWQLLRRMQIFVFDFASPGSSSEELAKERAAHALHSDHASRAADLWSSLTELAIKIASSGGDRTRDRLVEDLQQRSFRLTGDRHNLVARAALAEASRHTLADISDRVGGAMLMRHERVMSVHAALDASRYVEIRGDAGVGKSGVLKHFAEQMLAESQVIVLSPSRTIPKGWLAMRAVLGLEGPARDLLSDLASNGSGILFLDSLDFYDAEERLTIIDLVREAARVPGMSVVVTARRDFGVAEPSWLPAEALSQLGRAESVVIDEITEAETEELRNAAPQLRALLSDSHPARPVARNLFRLSRLASQRSDAPMPRTEVEMAEQWWQSADGERDQTHRERARLLRALGEQALLRSEQLDVCDFPASAVDALVKSESLRDLGSDRVTFRHDVLREWAIANVLFSDPAMVEQLPLDEPALADLARGVELAARRAVEGAADGTNWKSFVDSVSKKEYHGSWRRAALLALVRSEIGNDLLNRASSYLLDNNAQMLRELTRLVMAVDVESAKKRFSAFGVDPKLIPANLNVPNGPSWSRLIVWLLSLGESLPAAALPEVVDLYTAWSISMLGQDPFTPLLVQWLYRWLAEIEAAGEGSGVQVGHRPFLGELPYGQIGAVKEDLRTGFLTFCNRTPQLATEYLQSLSKDRHDERAARGILKFRGALAQAAPKELAELTVALLVPEDDEDDDDGGDPLREPFGHRDLDFLPASPAQGPFMELLVHAREHGLELVRKVVDHAISFKSGGRDFGANAIRIPSVDGSERPFPWVQSYGWSRDLGSGPAIVTSALMALEAWAHGRIDAGEPFDSVLADVLGPPNSPAAYLLVALDLILSHWPKSRVAAIPFLASPELLCLDRQRMLHDNLELPDIFGLKALQKEPLGLSNLASLKARPSRRLMLDQLLPYYALNEGSENRDTLTRLLRSAGVRLGPPTEHSNLGDPKFMAVHALNLIDPTNWHEKTVQTQNGPTDGWEYVPPATESQHLRSLQDDAWRERQTDAAMDSRIRVALNKPDQSSPAFATAAVHWAQSASPGFNDADTDDDRQSMRQETIVTAATVAARDGGPELIATQGSWMRETFTLALKGRNDPVHRMRSGLQFNPIAIAFVGMVLLLKNRFTLEDVHIILEAAGSDNPAAAHGYAATSGLLANIDERLPRAVLRCALAAAVHPRRDWRQPEAEYQTRADRKRQQIVIAIDAELAWLSGKKDEPEWPQFPPEPAHPRHRFLSRRRKRKEPLEEPPEPEIYTDHQAAALWLESMASLFDVAKRPWLREIVMTYSSWTTTANGSELDDGEVADHLPREWNDAFFKLLAYCLPGQTSAEVDQLALAPVMALSGEAFFDVTTPFLRNVDTVYFNDCTLPADQAVQIRSALAQRLMKTKVWERHVRDRSKSIETHFGPAIAVVLFNDYGHFQPAKCYLYPNAIDRTDPFLPILREIADNGTFLMVAIALLNLFEVAPRETQLPLIVLAGEKWLSAYEDDKDFWIDQGIGRRLCSLFETILALNPNLFRPDRKLRKNIDALLASLVLMGVAEAHRLEEALHLL